MRETRMPVVAKIMIVGVAAACLAACGASRSRPQVDLMDRSRDIFLLLRYDTNNDRQISKDEMEAGLKADYACRPRTSAAGTRKGPSPRH
jgi:hypothetical protein